MKNTISKVIITTLAISSLAMAVPVFAQPKIINGQNRGNQMIDQRLTSLDNLTTRIQGLKNVSDAQKASLVTTIQGVISSLNTLKSEIASDTSTSSLKTDLQSITQSNRVYALVLPQINIIAAGDRVQTIVAMMNAISTKLQARISMATTTASSTSSAISAAMADLTSKMTDASTQVQTAASGVSALVPDQGDKTKMASNTAALKDARTKTQAARKDIVAARKDIGIVVKALGK